MALSDPLLLLLPTTSLGRGNLHSPSTPITPLSAGRVGKMATATVFTTAHWLWTSALGVFG